MNNILTTLLDSSRIESNINESYPSLLLQIPTLSKHVLQSFLTSQFSIILTYKPPVDYLIAISEQGNWTYSRSSAGLISLIESVSTNY